MRKIFYLFLSVCFAWSFIDASSSTIGKPSLSTSKKDESTSKDFIRPTSSIFQAASSTTIGNEASKDSTIKPTISTSRNKLSPDKIRSPTTASVNPNSFTSDLTSVTTSLTSGTTISSIRSATLRTITTVLTEDSAYGITTPPPVNLNVEFLKELDELDEYMVNYTKFVSSCTSINPNSLSYCQNVDWLIPKNLALAPYFQDRMAKTAVETLNILTNGGTTQCQEKLKLIYCRQKFPKCYDIQEQVAWEINETKSCLDFLNECSPEAKKLLNTMKICEKLTMGAMDIHKCVAPMSPYKEEFCTRSNVSVWLNHADVEINSLLKYQFALNVNLTSECKDSLTKHMCFMGLQCFSNPDFNHTEYSKKVKVNCDSVTKVCKDEKLSKGIANLFLSCKKFGSTTE